MSVRHLAAELGARAAESGGPGTGVWVTALGVMIAAGFTALGALLGKRGEVRVDAAGQLSDKQIKFIDTVQADNEDLRGRVSRLERREDVLVERVSTLESLLRANGIPVPPPPTP